MERENAALKQRIIDDNKAYGCELMDPSGTIWDHAKRLQDENAALRELTSTLGAPNHINVPVEQWRELRADKERLDWIARNRSVSATERPLSVTPESLRASIDAARKEKP